MRSDGQGLARSTRATSPQTHRAWALRRLFRFELDRVVWALEASLRFKALLEPATLRVVT